MYIYMQYIYIHIHVHVYSHNTYTYIFTHTHTRNRHATLSRSLSLTHTHTHTGIPWPIGEKPHHQRPPERGHILCKSCHLLPWPDSCCVLSLHPPHMVATWTWVQSPSREGKAQGWGGLRHLHTFLISQLTATLTVQKVFWEFSILFCFDNSPHTIGRPTRPLETAGVDVVLTLVDSLLEQMKNTSQSRVN